MTKRTYTILDHNGFVIARGLTLADAADEIMSSDSREWDIRPLDGGWVAWSRQQVANRGWAPCLPLYSAEPDRAAAEREICEMIVAAPRWPGHVEALADDDYDAMVAAEAQEGA